MRCSAYEGCQLPTEILSKFFFAGDAGRAERNGVKRSRARSGGAQELSRPPTPIRAPSAPFTLTASFHFPLGSFPSVAP